MGSEYWLAEEARSDGVLTIGIGDGGNEIGFGMIRDAVREIQPHGSHCRCPCAGGVATVTSCDILVAAAVSNWGAYGISAYLGYLRRNADLLQDEEMERRVLESCAFAGGTDSIAGAQIPGVDGIPLGIHQAIVRMLHAIVASALSEIHRGF